MDVVRRGLTHSACYLYAGRRKREITSVSSNRYQFRNLAEGVYFATASDRYAGWMGQIYSEDQGYKIKSSTKTLKGQKFNEEKVPVRSAEEFFQHYGALELDFTFYSPLLNDDGTPSRNYAPLAEYAKWVPSDAKILLKVPEVICAKKHWAIQSGKRTFAENPNYLDAKVFTQRFYTPATEIMGNRIAGFIFEKGYQRKDATPPPEENTAELERFFSDVPKDNRYHIEERTDRLKTAAYFDFLRRHKIGNVFSHWTWLPDLKRQWEQAGGFTGALSVTRLMTPLRVPYEEAYARYFPFDTLKDEFPQMYRDTALIIREGMSAGIPTVTVSNNRAGGNANEINWRVVVELGLGTV